MCQEINYHCHHLKPVPLEVKTMAKKLTQKDQIYEQIKRDIILGIIKPGEVLNAIDMSERHNFGITPTREALLVLTHDRYLKPMPRVGYIVTEPAVQDILEIFHLRMILEVEAIGLAVDRFTDREIQELKKNNQKEEEIFHEVNGQAREQGLNLNKDFHITIARASGNTRLMEIVQQLIQDLMRSLLLDPELTDSSDHARIIRLIEKRDKIQAQEEMRKHIEETRRRVLNRF
jgi:DNA-binding GntR family transcriptional regulator